jgi:tetratricopeptide (TPR) repeat protein
VYAALLTLLAPVCLAQSTPQIGLDTSESLFAVLTAINACGFDMGLAASDTVRSQVRSEVESAVQASADAQETKKNMCELYSAHRGSDDAHTLAQYISLALYLGPPPQLAPKVKDADLPPDASAVSGIVPPLQAFYAQAGLHAIWERHRVTYEELPERFHDAVAKMLFDTEIYLKMPSAGYLGRGFTVYLDPMGDPGQTNARNYGSNYYVVISPGSRNELKMEQIRHTYLHYLLDPLTLKYPAVVKQVQPLLQTVKNAPMDDSFKTDAGLLVTECMVRAVEARTAFSPKTPETQREQAVAASEAQGFVLTRYFYDALGKFEKDPAGLRSVYGDMLAGIDVRKEQKEAAQVKFAAQAEPEVLRVPQAPKPQLLLSASQRLSAGDPAGAQQLAQQALDQKSEDQGQALFIMAQAATMSRDMPGARKYFQQAIEVAHEPKVVAWSHIFLGRIFDLQEDRAAALDQYRAALSAGASLPEAKAAAERGIQQPYEPPRPPQAQPEGDQQKPDNQPDNKQ